MSDNNGDISDVSEDPEFIPYTLPSVENITMYDRQLALAKRQKTSRKDAAADSDPLLNHELIVKLGKKYVVTVFPWPSADMFMCRPLPDSPEPESSERFENGKFEMGLVRELHLYLNDRALCKLAADYAPFRQKFIHQAKQGHAAMLHTVRDCAYLIMSEIDMQPDVWILKAGSPLRRDSTVLKALLEFPGSSAANSPFSPIFYPNMERDNTKLFMNEYQPKILRAIFFGKQSLSSDPSTFNYGTSLVGMLWGVKSVNNACIALSAMITQFLLSDDTEFNPVGKNSKMNYKKDYIAYRTFLNGLNGTNYLQMLYVFKFAFRLADNELSPGLYFCSSVNRAGFGLADPLAIPEANNLDMSIIIRRAVKGEVGVVVVGLVEAEVRVRPKFQRAIAKEKPWAAAVLRRKNNLRPVP
ncbi:hypothetical protein BDP27DRAFT_1371004 [Rhodocollybia butyracea]|uniref:Uncharacterized protein n=1 Tax=Rhodocollybia butyracea TaxID=206335 RepID=A0A9P5P7Y2_9AGAR|nr:hypothetical protein BDP27DRAFT_1371004 [Rhodocollybia butyracea]